MTTIKLLKAVEMDIDDVLAFINKADRNELLEIRDTVKLRRKEQKHTIKDQDNWKPFDTNPMNLEE